MYVTASCSVIQHGRPWHCRIDEIWRARIPLQLIPRSIDTHMANWKVIEIVSGNIEAVSGHAAHGRPGTDRGIVWEGEAADKAEALKCVEKADPRVDLDWMRICYERDLDTW